MRFFDAHCHLQDPRLERRVPAVLASARAAGVTDMLCCGTDESDWRLVLDLAERHPEIVPALGLHPWRVATRSGDWLSCLRRLLENAPAAAVGEVGLDRAGTEPDMRAQREAFLAQWRLAVELGRPVSLHCRRAWGALRHLLAEAGAVPVGFAVHAYSGSAETLDWLLAAGGSISFSGMVLSERCRRTRAAVAQVPAHRLLIETDAPSLLPRGISVPSGCNEPAVLPRIASAVAAVRGVALEDVAESAWRNARRLFRFGRRVEGAPA